MRNRGGDIMEEASWRRAWLARGGLRPWVPRARNVRFCLHFHGKCELREGEARTGATQRSRSIEFFLSRFWWDGKRDGSGPGGKKSCQYSPPVTEQGRPFAKAFGKNMYRCGYRPLIGKSNKRCAFLLVREKAGRRKL